MPSVYNKKNIQLHVSKWLFFQSKDRMSIEEPQQLSVNSRRSYIFSSHIVDRAPDKLVEISLSKSVLHRKENW